MKNNGFTLIELLLVIAIIGIIGGILYGVLPLVGPNGEEKAASALSSMGMTNIEYTGNRWTGCGVGDTFHTGFCAINISKKRVCGVVCSSMTKGGTVRFD